MDPGFQKEGALIRFLNLSDFGPSLTLKKVKVWEKKRSAPLRPPLNAPLYITELHLMFSFQRCLKTQIFIFKRMTEMLLLSASYQHFTIRDVSKVEEKAGNHKKIFLKFVIYLKIM